MGAKSLMLHVRRRRCSRLGYRRVLGPGGGIEYGTALRELRRIGIPRRRTDGAILIGVG